MESLSRRQFMIGASLGGLALAGGTFAKGMLDPTPSGVARFPVASCGDAGSARILVAYASEFGTTGEVAGAMAQDLCAAGYSVTSRRVTSIAASELAGFDGVIVGGPIQYDRWKSEASSFVTDHEAALSRIPVAYFLTCMTLSKPSPEATAKVAGYAAKLASTSALVSPVAVGRFAGVLDYSLMSPVSRGAARIVYTAARVSEGDFRDWNAISEWTTETATSLP